MQRLFVPVHFCPASVDTALTELRRQYQFLQQPFFIEHDPPSLYLFNIPLSISKAPQPKTIPYPIHSRS